AGDTAHIGEVMELLAHAYTQANELQKARNLYRELAQTEPENELHAKNYRQVVAKMGDEPTSRISAEQGQEAFMVDELEIASPELEQKYSEDVADAVKAALTDSELLDSYNLPAKAIEPLENVLPKPPRDAKVNQRLASLYARADRYADPAA